AKGLSHEDSLLQPPFRSNCLNWVLGHIAVSRDDMLHLVGQEGLLTAEEITLYNRGSEAITADNAVSLESLLARLKASGQQIRTALKEASPDLAETIVDEESKETLIERLAGLQWHETYHIGQLEILRQIAGTDDVIIP
ncbi:MAG: DinB family protein, partial [Chloroflexota bacterium]